MSGVAIVAFVLAFVAGCCVGALIVIGFELRAINQRLSRIGR